MFERQWHDAYPESVPNEIDFERITVPEMLDRTVEKFGSHTAISFEGKEISYSALGNLVNRFSRALVWLGVDKGKKVAILMPNVPQIIVAIQSVLRIGAITVMNNPLYTVPELEKQLNDAGATFLITTEENLDKALKLRGLTDIETIITSADMDLVLDENRSETNFPDSEGRYRFLELIEEQAEVHFPSQAMWEDVGNILYTGGTTGVSKGVLLTHSNLSCNVQQYSSWMYDTVDGQEIWPIIYPVFHAAGYVMCNKGIHTGWNNILILRPTPNELVELIAKEKPTIFPGVSTIFVGLLNFEKFRALDLSHIKAFLTGGGPLALDTLNQLKAIRNVPVINVYGLTESGPVATATPWNSSLKPLSVGIPYPNTDIKTVDMLDGETILPIGEAGEICIKGPQVMKGYLNRPEATAAVLCEGWLRTGDIGFVDEEGYLTLIDRKKDVIVASGFNVYPKEIDDLLFAHPKVLEVCTIGIPHDYRGETVKVYIVPKRNVQIEEQEIIEYCRENLAPYKVPRLIDFIEALPKSAVGKILRKDLRALATQQRKGK